MHKMYKIDKNQKVPSFHCFWYLYHVPTSCSKTTQTTNKKKIQSKAVLCNCMNLWSWKDSLISSWLRDSNEKQAIRYILRQYSLRLILDLRIPSTVQFLSSIRNKTQICMQSKHVIDKSTFPYNKNKHTKTRLMLLTQLHIVQG